MKKILKTHLLISHKLSLIHSHLWIGSLMSTHLMTWIHLRSHMKKSTVFLSYLPINCLLLLIILKTKLCIFKISLLNRACRTQKGDFNIKGILSTEGPLRKRERETKKYFPSHFRMVQSNSSQKKGMVRGYLKYSLNYESVTKCCTDKRAWHLPHLNAEGSVISTLLTIFSMTCFHLCKGGISNAASFLKILFRAFLHSVYQKYILRSFTNTHHLVSGFLSTLLSPLF